MSIDGRTRALKDGPYGKCVYRCDNDVVDHQVVNIEYENEVTAAFTMCCFTSDSSRTLKLMGTEGEIRGNMTKNEIELFEFSTGAKNSIKVKKSPYKYGGGDFGIVEYFVKKIREGALKGSYTSINSSIESHLIAFAAEESRLEHRVIELKSFTEGLKQTIR